MRGPLGERGLLGVVVWELQRGMQSRNISGKLLKDLRKEEWESESSVIFLEFFSHSKQRFTFILNIALIILHSFCWRGPPEL